METSFACRHVGPDGCPSGETRCQIYGTAKPAISPIADELTGGEELDPIVAANGSKLDIRTLRKTLNEKDWQTFGSGEVGDPSGKAWTEFGDIDKLGHNFGVKAATRFADEIGE